MKILLQFARSTVLIAIILLSSFSAQAQKEAKRYYEADEALSAENYSEALTLFQEVSAINPKFEGTEYKQIACELMMDPEKSPDPYLALEGSYNKDEYYFYWQGKIYLQRYLFEDAVVAFRRFREQSEFNGNTQDQNIQELMAQTSHLLKFFDNPDDFEIHQLESPVNTNANELTPVYSKENQELLFASNKGGQDYKIYYSKKDGSGWTPPKVIPTLGSFTESTANVEVVNEDGKLFLFREDNGGDLYYSHPKGDNWTSPIEFDSKVSNNQLASHFFINEHEDRIIFATENKTTGLDIYESFRDPENGKWSKPAPFSIAINTEFNEDSPYLSLDEKSFYFVSDRPGGVGGYDIYLSKLDEVNYSWSEPTNLGWPINSPDDEFHFKMNADQASGYFVSDRLHTKGGYDIYFFWKVEKVKITGRLTNAQGNPVSNAQIRFRPSQYSDEYFHSTTNSNGQYTTEIFSNEIFNVEILSGGKVIFNDKFEVHDTGGEKVTHFKDFRIN
ncbi:hypothetical protein [Marinoscillum sp. MHG1-6]|uniref:hypothetical protein n=1 Tax=Marinoscillum sp. MHG1-6 TaxID=2959627 RepID=UPI002158577F|nr:hypothetical protein [Marinoscillum sp. MHG1-6]